MLRLGRGGVPLPHPTQAHPPTHTWATPKQPGTSPANTIPAPQTPPPTTTPPPPHPPPQETEHLFETEATRYCCHQRRLSSTTLAPWRSVILAFGHRSQAAGCAARASMGFSRPARCSRMFLPSSVHTSIRYANWVRVVLSSSAAEVGAGRGRSAAASWIACTMASIHLPLIVVADGSVISNARSMASRTLRTPAATSW